MKRNALTLLPAFPGEPNIDNFADAGCSTGLEEAFGRLSDVAINHSPEATAMHAVKHPHTQQLCESVWDVGPINTPDHQPTGLDRLIAARKQEGAS